MYVSCCSVRMLPSGVVVILANNLFLPDTFRDLRNNDISWAIEDASEAFSGLKSLTKLYVSVMFISNVFSMLLCNVYFI
jgi:hypothetical protein